MLARDLAVPFPMITMEDDALDAARLMAEHHLPGVIVCRPDGRPAAVLPGSQVLTFVIPQYVRDDAALARVIGERGADRLLAELRGKTVGDLLPARSRPELVTANPDDTVLELCVLMARAHSPLVAVVENGVLVGCVTLPRVLDVLLAGH